MKKGKYWYYYTKEGMAPGNQPGGFVNQKTNMGEFGSIAYDRELTNDELDKFSLVPVEDKKK